MGKDQGLIVESWPHIKSRTATPFVMLEVVLALLPAVGFSIYFFGLHSLRLILVSVLSCGLTEFGCCLLRKKPSTLGDFSFLVTGILLALILPPNLPLGITFLGGVVSIVIGKEIFGGLGQNIFNPALLGRAFLMASFPVQITTWIRPFDGLSCATPLALWKFQGVISPLRDLFWGNVGGCLGETSALAIILGGLYLIFRKIADWRIPLFYLLTVVLFSLFKEHSLNTILFQLLSGGLLLGAFFMATDPVSSPITKKGRMLFGIGCGVITMVIRYFGGLPEGVMYSILFMNALSPLLNKATLPKPLGLK